MPTTKMFLLAIFQNRDLVSFKSGRRSWWLDILYAFIRIPKHSKPQLLLILDCVPIIYCMHQQKGLSLFSFNSWTLAVEILQHARESLWQVLHSIDVMLCVLHSCLLLLVILGAGQQSGGIQPILGLFYFLCTVKNYPERQHPCKFTFSSLSKPECRA